MVNTELLNYVQSQLAQGVPKETIKSGLLASGGWNETDINEAFAASGQTPLATTPQFIPQNQPIRTFQVKDTGAKRHIFLKLIFWLVMLIIIVAIGAYAALAFIIKPEDAIANAIKKIGTAEKLHSDLTVNLISEKDTATSASLKVITDADHSPGDLKIRTVGSLSYPMFSGEIEVRIFDDMIFARALKLPDSLGMYSEIVGTRWYSVSIDTLKKAASEYASSAEVTKVNVPTLDGAYKMLMDSGIVSEARFAGISKTSAGFVRKYVVEINKNKYLEGIEDVSGAVGTKNPYAALGKSILSSISIEPITFSTSLISGSLREVKFGVGSESAAMKLNVTMGYDDTVEVMNIEKPEDAMPVDSYLLNYGQSSPSASTTPQ